MSSFPFFFSLISLAWLFCDAQDVKQTNLLMIMFDDLRPELSVYGKDYMITPNFERLAKKSVVFDYAFCQVAVCNPSRDSLMTGLRPDSVGTLNFGHSYWPHMTLPHQLVRSGYNTAGIGKIFHWESTDKNIWNFDAWDNKWYDYQGEEWNKMNSSTMPDKYLPEEKFRDFLFADRAINTWKKMLHASKPYMLAIGFKLPHLCIHVPYRHYTMYKDKKEAWKLNKRELRFPPTTTEISYRCCADNHFKFMRDEGAQRYNRTVHIADLNQPIPNEVHDEMMMGYCAGVSFVDEMVGRLLDFMDQNSLWDNTTVVLASDHGMHNGEKGIWEKWTLFEEATRVPLMIHHPNSPFKGSRYPYPVELVDVYATLNQILKVPKARADVCKGLKCKPLQGKSLAPVILGKEIYEKNFGSLPADITTSTGTGNTLLQSVLQKAQQTVAGLTGQSPTASTMNIATSSVMPENMPVLQHNFALSQAVRCAPLDQIPAVKKTKTKQDIGKVSRQAIWNDCDLNKPEKNMMTLLGYSMRTPEYRYTAYFHYNRTTQRPDTKQQPYEEELYDHKNETLADFTHRETFNLAVRPSYSVVMQALRTKLVNFIDEKIKFGDH